MTRPNSWSFGDVTAHGRFQDWPSRERLGTRLSNVSFLLSLKASLKDTIENYYHHEMLPLSFQNLFQTGSQIHNCSTRYAESYVLMQAYRTNMKQFTILYQRTRLWNSLPHSIIRWNNIRIFKRLLKSYLINLHNAQKVVWNLLLIIR